MPRVAARIPSQPDILSILHRVSALASLDTEHLLALEGHVRLQEVPRGTLVTVEGHPVDALYIVASGSFRRFRTSPSGREQILALLATGDSFGEVPLLDGIEDFASTQAMQRGAVFVVPGEQFRAVLTGKSNSLSDVCLTFTAQIRRMADIIDDLSFCHVAERIAGLILERAFGPEQPHLTQATMAAMAGTTREVVARTIRELDDSGAIAVDHGHISVRDVALLRRIAGDGDN